MWSLGNMSVQDRAKTRVSPSKASITEVTMKCVAVDVIVASDRTRVFQSPRSTRHSREVVAVAEVGSPWMMAQASSPSSI